jgi:hypothetical protein
MQSWHGDTVAAGEDTDAEIKLIWILAAWCKRQCKTSVEFHELVELLGLEGSLAQLLEQRSTKPR